MTQPSRAATNALAARLREGFESAGAVVVEPPILQPAGTLLDLYGEDLRARAYVTSDALRGEQMLRPDFTVPVVQMHMESGAEPARYTYAGEVFRCQDDHPNRPSEYVQVGYELFDRTNSARADADVFAQIAAPLKNMPISPIVGDIGLLKSAVTGLQTSAARKAALMRHIWRPNKFDSLLRRFSGAKAPSPARLALLNATDPFANVPVFAGKRSRAQIEARLTALRADLAEAPICEDDTARIAQLLAIRAPLTQAVETLQNLAKSMPAIGGAVRRVAARTEALADLGIAVDQLLFDASHGRMSMEYYDGFVFAFHADTHADWPAVASGGRYDALTERLGKGRAIPAVGGVIRPGLMLSLGGQS